ncbi:MULTISPECIES: flagellar hook-associated protein 2 [unclassified Sporosarcina]|uniref:flagellar hook-associated protein 2 n=1 Tax=unclassified Sporosarcina TaxID=2647733 RepID=UPI00203F1259|nr:MULTISPECIES: flagellar hook-associated protein 2 [unclassified Sporosarcina]GKV65843.1 flagellar hook-associated protein 2 [Sporosarcina sp. NCCP-2331]GLB55968.1 flagellar hook-associated protein 2 [Sporosarcina sp. NCCP-2378]
MRIGGLASGMDTDQIIKDMMKAHRIPLDKITQKKAYTTWQMEDYRSINRDLRKTSDKLFDTVIKQSTYLQKNVNVSDDKAVSIKSLNASNDFSGTLKVEQLATQATLQSGKLTKTVDDKQVNLSESEIATMQLKSFDSSISDTSEIKISVGGKSQNIKVSSSDSIGAVIAQINKETGVNAFYDEYTGRIALTAKNSGDTEIKIENIAGGNLGDKLKLTDVFVPDDALNPSNKPTNDQALSAKGENAIFVFNGLETQRESNTFQINGFEVTLKQVTDSPVTFSSSADSDKIVDSVVQFVNDYNEMIEKLNSKIKEKNFRDFHPLSDEQKADMKEKEIELWEEKAKSGTLRNDPAISSMLTNLRGIMTKSVITTDANGESMKISLKDLGIEPSKSYSDNGKLVINEDTLRSKIAENPNAVYDLIGRDAKDEKGVNGTAGTNSGIAQDFRKELAAAQKSISEKAGNSTAVNDTFALGRSLKSMDKQIDRFENKLQMMETRYYKQFAAMERAIQRANAQSAQLMQSLGGGM